VHVGEKLQPAIARNDLRYVPMPGKLAILPTAGEALQYAAKKREQQPSRREQRDEWLKKEITRVWEDRRKGRRVYGARKVWLQLRREGIEVARCTVARLMKSWALPGSRPGGRSRVRRCPVPASSGSLTCWDGTSPRPALVTSGQHRYLINGEG
jgi:hypothetical protein